MYDEGFDLTDEQYEAWLRINHLEQFRSGNGNLYYNNSSTHTQRTVDVTNQMISWRVMNNGTVLLQTLTFLPLQLSKSGSMFAGWRKDFTSLMTIMGVKLESRYYSAW